MMRLSKPCLDCGTITTNPTRCTPCASAHTSAHRAARARVTARVEAGFTRCSRCGLPVYPGEAWDIDRTPTGWYPSHRACNPSTSSRSRRPWLTPISRPRLRSPPAP